jgi:hypothetical protein
MVSLTFLSANREFALPLLTSGGQEKHPLLLQELLALKANRARGDCSVIELYAMKASVLVGPAKAFGAVLATGETIR